ncbi:MAG TPA: M20/M25/M40 family metallo-hydrolase, partial [Chitinophagaceae bacterium]
MKLATKLLFVLFICSFTAAGQDEKLDTNMIARIREQGLDHSQVDTIAHYLTDVSGPRLTNSPGYRHAVNWCVTTMKKWGLANAAAEPWGEFGTSWEIQKSYVAMSAPYYHQLIAYPYGWSAGTKSPVSATVVALADGDSSAAMKAGASLRGKIVMLTDTFTTIRSAFKAYATRFSDSDLANLKQQYWATYDQMHPFAAVEAARKRFYRLLESKGVAAIVTKDYGGRDGSVYADVIDAYERNAHPLVPRIIVSSEDFIRMQRLIASHIPVKLDLDIRTKFNYADTKASNVVAEIPGTDPKLKDELVIIGGHLDSWYAGTGATDNAAGCAVMMEVMRILKTLNVQPRRTIRIVLWGGEEQGLIGSYNYVKNHFADPVTKELRPDQAKVSAYYNLDNGSGKVRGIFLQENEALRPIFEKWMAPFADLGATAVKSGNTGFTDHYTFDIVGIPGFEFIQDPLEYLTRTHHSNMDVYDHLSIPDLKQAATV